MNDLNQLEMTGVHHAYGRLPVLRDVSLSVARGELACLLGPSGCGKTTLLRVIAGLEPVQRGRVVIGGEVMADAASRVDAPPERRGIGLMFQDYALFPHLTVRRNVTFGLARGSARSGEWVDQALARVGLAGYAGRYPHTLSGGQQQRVALLRALAPEPRLMLLDEPFSGLDITLRAQVRAETLELLKDFGTASVMVTHDPEEAMSMADTIMVMDRGVIVQRGTPADLYLAPANPFVAELFGPVNRLAGRVRAGRVATALGDFPAPHLAETTAVQVLIRHEGVSVSTSAAGQSGCVPGRLVSARLVGRTSRVRLTVGEATESAVTLEARIPLPPGANAGDRVWVAADRDRALVFPAD